MKRLVLKDGTGTKGPELRLDLVEKSDEVILTIPTAVGIVLSKDEVGQIVEWGQDALLEMEARPYGGPQMSAPSATPKRAVCCPPGARHKRGSQSATRRPKAKKSSPSKK